MFNPAIHTATNKPVGLIGKPVDARTYFYDEVNFVYRAYVSTAEVLTYLNTASDRVGQFPIIINTGGSLSAGIITGGTNAEWWFKDGVADVNLVFKSGVFTTRFKFSAGDAIPGNIDMTTLPNFGIEPTCICRIKDVGNDTRLAQYPDIIPYYNYADNTYAVLNSIDIYGHDDGTGHFNEDTYITIKP